MFCAHTGFDGLGSVGDIWHGDLIGSTIRVKSWLIPADRIPPDAEHRTEWLYGRRQELDDWVGENLASGGGTQIALAAQIAGIPEASG